MDKDGWSYALGQAVLEAKRGKRSYPVEIKLDFLPTHEEVCEALRIARQMDSRVSAVEHRRNWGDPNATSSFIVRVSYLDPNPPAFLEQFPIPLVR